MGLKRMKKITGKVGFLTRIKENSTELTGKQVEIADYIIRHYDKAAFLTAGRLASRVGVSESTVIRFATSLGYTGYPDFQDHLQRIIREELTSTERLQVSLDAEAEKDIFGRIFVQEIENMQGLFNRLPRAELEAAAGAISEADRVFVTGIRAARCLAQHFAFQLGRVHENVVEVSSAQQETWDFIKGGKPKDLLFAIAFPRYPRETVELVDFAISLDMQVIGLTDRMASPIARRCRPILLAPVEMVTFVDLYSGPLAVLSALVAEVAFRDEEKAFAYLQKFEDFARQMRVFHKE
ncbi:MAG: MurR/RpiR family transcriptional regulator [Deltaproteobacteria bacterium]|nr:MurR/RpiR family transcriptional regulator [Deltaproteobacteria bacterium]